MIGTPPARFGTGASYGMLALSYNTAEDKNYAVFF
jgi:hypothetical protein